MIATHILETCAAGACLLSCASQTPVNTTSQGQTGNRSAIESSVSSTETRKRVTPSNSKDGNSIKLDFIPQHQRVFREELGLGRLRSPCGTYGIEGHGTPDCIKSRTGRPISPAELAAWIHRDPRYQTGMPIYLFACDTGRGSRSFAQQLADVMQAPVVAPTERLWPRKGGNYETGAATCKKALGFIPLGEGIRDPAQQGEMKNFLPDTPLLAAR